MLRNLQGNILKGHGRDHTWNVFFELGEDKEKSLRVLREIGNFYVTDAFKQLLETEAFKTEKKEGGTFCCAFLSASGYKAIGKPFPSQTGSSAFDEGMRSEGSLDRLVDPPVAEWEKPFRERLDGMILIGDDNTDRGSATATKIHGLLKDAGADVHHTQVGKAIRNSVGNGLEHFGYIDGRSQPLMLVEDIEKESRDEGLAHWDPSFPLSTALLRDPLVPFPEPGTEGEDPEAYGSFFIFRKLRQDVAGFKSREQVLANELGLKGEERELAGAYVVGRFEDGTPVTMSDEAKGRKDPANDFDYSADTQASRCPFHAHIRKTNPRGSGGFGQDEFKQERSHIMARRGIPYEDTPREFHPDGLPDPEDEKEFKAKVLPFLPDKKDNLGLLFMAYNSKLDRQFVFTQQTWANNTDFPQHPQGAAGRKAGIDGVIGQFVPDANSGKPDSVTAQEYPTEWDSPGKGVTKFDFKGFVTMKGGEYFFAPSVHFLRSL